MNIEEADIDYSKLNSKEFEELCFDIILRLGFHSVVWRKGGADNGRDIQAKFTTINPLVENYIEEWFFECKLYSNGIPPDELSSKITWADAEQPQHFVLLTNSHLTNNCRTWINRTRENNKPYKIHLIEGKQLTKVLISLPAIVAKYFCDDCSKLVSNAKQNWISHGLLPDWKTISTIHKKLDPRKLSRDDLAFLYCASSQVEPPLDEYGWDVDKSPEDEINFDFLLSYLEDKSDGNQPIEGIPNSPVRSHVGQGLVISTEYQAGRNHWIYVFHQYSNDSVIEVKFEAQSNGTTTIRNIKSDAL